jgi:hypothetical protein
MEQKITIDSRTLAPEDLAGLLEPVEFASINIETRSTGTRAGDASVVTAIVSSVLSFIISLLGVFKKQATGDITITGKSGWSVKVPVGTSRQDISKYIDEAREKDIESITV